MFQVVPDSTPERPDSVLVSLHKFCESRRSSHSVYNRHDMCLTRRLSLLVLLLISATLIACGSSGTSQESVDSSERESLEPVPILSPDSTFTIDQLIDAGWKSSRQLSAETLPNAQSAWYGFYQQRDVEVRIYPSHQAALTDGTGPADEATGRGKPAPFAVGGISATRTSYGAYAIAGNLVVPCEVQISECIGLLESLN